MIPKWGALPVLVLLCNLIACTPRLWADDAKVLIVYSDHDEMPWQSRIERAVHDTLSGNPAGRTIFEEQMDAMHFPSAADQHRIGDLIVAKYRAVKLDAVITESEAAAQFLLDHPAAFPGSQRYFVDADLAVPPGGGTRFISHDNFEGTLDLVTTLFPQVLRVVLIDGSETRSKLLADYWRAHWAASYSFEVWNNLSFPELDQKTQTLPRDSLLVFGVLGRDRLGKVEAPVDVAQRLFRLAPVPGLVLYDSLVGTGAVGGAVLSASRVGELVANLAEGRLPEANSVSFVSPMFDAQALARWHVPTSRLPAQSVLVNSPKHLFTPEQEITVFVALVAIVALLLAMLLLTLMHQNRRRTLEAQKREAVDRLLKTSERVPGVVFQYRWKPDGTASLPFASQAIRQVYRVDPEAVRDQGSVLTDMVHPDDRERVTAALRDSARSLTPWEQQYRVKFGDGSERYLHGSAVPEREADGSVLWHGFISDVTDRVGAERIIQSQSAQLRSLFDTIPDLIWLKDVNGVYLACNRRYESYRGLEAKDIIGKTDYDLVDIEAARRYRGSDLEVMRTGVLRHDEHEFTFADGHVELTEAIKAPVRNADGTMAGVVGVGRDMSQRRKDLDALRQSEDAFLKAFQASPEATFVDSEADAKILVVNDAFVKAVGLARSEILGRSAEDLGFRLLPEELSTYADEFARQGAVRKYEVRFRNPTGEVRSFLGNVERIEMYGRKCRLAFLLDVTEARRIEQEKSRLQSLLVQSQKMESLGVLAGGLAHEMNNVLASILTVSRTKLLTLAEGDPGRRAFETIAKASERGGKTVGRLLGFTRKAPVEDRELDFNALIVEQVALLSETVPANVRIETLLALQLPPVLGDRAALIQALANLCSNALDAMGETGTLTLETLHHTGKVEVRVRDTGGGMPREVLEKALDPFFTTKPPGKGTGLGLSLVYRTVQTHRGNMEFQSEPGKGTVIVLEFPAATACERQDDAPETQTGPIRSPWQILVVDDDEMIRDSLKDLLEVLGHRVIVTTGGDQALRYLERGPLPDVVLLDMNMPEMSGEETLARLRGRYGQLPVVLTTGRSDQRALDLVSSFPRVFLLPKPFAEAELLGVLGEI